MRSSARLTLLLLLAASPAFAETPRLKLLFLGDAGPHRPADRFRQLAPELKKRGIDLTYTDRLDDLNAKRLAGYDGLMVYANHTKIAPEQEKALIDYVEGGKGFVPLHCASFCFLNSPAYIALVGAQFRSHDTGTFRATVAEPTHPVMRGYRGFESWDETYTHHKHNAKDRTVLEYRDKEPWTWARTQGKGRVFYTAWGHDARTWGHPGFANLVERGTRWACGGDPSVVPPFGDVPAMTAIAKDAPSFAYADAKVPFYPAGMRWGTTTEPLTKMQKPMSPEDSLKHMSVPEGFELKLFASEKLLGGKPICMSWDERGRLWVAVTMDYPNELQPKGMGRDRILIVEDTKGAGVADKVTTFADRLSIPTSLTFANGGVIVHQAPETLFLKDTNGDDVADERMVLLRGWATNDTHAGPSNLQYGLDNYIHGMVGYAGFVGEVGGERHSFRQGFYRFRPDGSAMEFLRNTNNNSWGVGFSEDGLHFGSTANGNPSVYLPIPNRYYEKVRGWSSSVLGGIARDAKISPITDKVRQVDHHGGFTAAAGHALYTARAYPREYWNRTAFVTEPTGHLVTTFVLERNGADFTARNPWNLLASDDEWCAPIMAEVGPDGSVWILDWYNYIVQHNPTPAGFKTGKGNAYETELRDKKHGRIYRLVYTGAKPAAYPKLSKDDPKGLVAALKNDNMRWRLHAQRLLVERGDKDVVDALYELVLDKTVDEIGLNVGAIHALWTLHGLKAVDERAHVALKHPSAGVRRNASLVLPPTKESGAALLAAMRDPDAHVALAARLALATMPADRTAGDRLAVRLEAVIAGDPLQRDAVAAAAAAHAEGFLLATDDEDGVDATPAAAGVLTVVARHYALGTPKAGVDEVLRTLAKKNGSRRVETILSGLADGWKAGHEVPLSEETEKALVAKLPALSPAGKGALVRLMGALGSKAVAKHAAGIVKVMLKSAVEDGDAAAARQAVELAPADDAVVAALLEALTPRSSPEFAREVIDAVAAGSAPGSGKALLAKLPGATPATRAAVVRVLLTRAAWAAALLDAAEKGTVRFGDLSLDQKQALATHPDRAVRERAKAALAKGGDLPNPDRQKVIDSLLPLLKKAGDVAGGKKVFEAQCAKCHKHTGLGADIGPDLTGMAVHPKHELLRHIMDPSRDVEGNFRVWTVVTTKGVSYTGMLANETKTTVEIVDAEAKKTVVRRDRIEKLEASSKSLMPEGFEKQLKGPELIDLLEFLTARGKYLPLPLDRVATIVSTQGMFFEKSGTAERMAFADWKPKTFAGVPFVLVDPLGDTKRNVVLLYGPGGTTAPTMPKAVKLPCNSSAKAIHLLGGVAGWASPLGTKGSVSLIVRLHYADGKTEDHELRNGEDIADYIRRVDVPKSQFAFDLRGRQVRYLAIEPKRDSVIKDIEFVKGPDGTAPIVMAVTLEGR